jgi:hypothetical protein
VSSKGFFLFSDKKVHIKRPILCQGKLWDIPAGLEKERASRMKSGWPLRRKIEKNYQIAYIEKQNRRHNEKNNEKKEIFFYLF